MKKKLFIFLFVVCILGICTACEGDLNRDLRHAGYTFNNTKFICDPFFKADVPEQIRFLTPNRAITTEGVIYELSPGKKYSNEQNCRVANTGLRVSAIFDDTVFLATNGGIYRFVGDDNNPAYSEISASDQSYAIYATLFYSGTGIKYSTVGDGLYYSLSPDGNVYGYSVYDEDRNSPPQIVGMTIIYNKGDYGNIIDYHYAGESTGTYVRTNDAFYHMTMTNEKECTTYADIPCEYIMTNDEILEKNAEFIYAYNGSTIYTTYQKVFSQGSGMTP